MLQMSGTSAELTNWKAQTTIGWSPRLPLIKILGYKVPGSVSVVNFTHWKLTVVGTTKAEPLTAGESHGRRLCPAGPRQSRSGDLTGTGSVSIPTCIPRHPPQHHHKGTACSHHTLFCPELLFHTALGRKQNTKWGRAVCWTFPWLISCLEAKQNETLGI